jgi:mannose/fructose/N-acetylgalactosamine-specific phosphotransferase system component IID
MQRALGPDIGAFFGRPASQAEGLQVLGMGQQQAMYGTTPQATDPMMGVNLALQQQANQTALNTGAMAANAQARGGLFSGLGQLGGGLLSGGLTIFGG